MDADTDRRHLVSPDAAVSGSYHCGGYPTPYIPAFPGLGLPPLGGDAAVQALQRGI